MDIVNMFFENGWIFVMFLFFNMGLIGIAGGAYMKNRDYAYSSMATFGLVLLAFSYVFYQVTTSIITKQVLTESSTPSATYVDHDIPANTYKVHEEVVYFNGRLMTSAEHEQLLAYSAQNSPGDDDH